jgi:hypothetical protein
VRELAFDALQLEIEFAPLDLATSLEAVAGEFVFVQFAMGREERVNQLSRDHDIVSEEGFLNKFRKASKAPVAYFRFIHLSRLRCARIWRSRIWRSRIWRSRIWRAIIAYWWPINIYLPKALTAALKFIQVFTREDFLSILLSKDR